MTILLMKLLVCALTPSPGVEANIVYQNEAAEAVSEEKKEERADTSLNNVLFGSGVGLIAVGGIGAGVVAHNNNKPKNVPTNKSKDLPSENDIDK